MKDFLGKRVRVGDTVAWVDSYGPYGDLCYIVGKVDGKPQENWAGWKADVVITHAQDDRVKPGERDYIWGNQFLIVCEGSHEMEGR